MIVKYLSDCNPFKKGKKYSAIDWLLLLAILAGVAAAAINFLHNRSLWLDEASIALNISGRSFGGLLAPQDFRQMAPVGFMLLEKWCCTIFGDHDWALRIIPFISYLLSIPLFFLLTRRLLRSERFALLASVIFANNPLYIYYAAEVKQYATETMISMLMVYMVAAGDSDKSPVQVFILAVAGAVSVWISNTAVIILFTIGLYMMYTSYGKLKTNLAQTAVPLTTWMLSFFFCYFFFIRQHPFHADQVDMWVRLNSFLPANPLSRDFCTFLADKTRWIFLRFPTSNNHWIIVSLLCFIGISGFFNEKRILFIFFFPIAVHLFLSALRIYPFHHRLILYLTPFLMIVFLSGLKVIFTKSDSIFPYLSKGLLTIFTLIICWKAISYVPVERSEIKQGMAYLDRIVNKEDVILVNSFTSRSFRFYRNHYPAITANINTIAAAWDLHSWTRPDSLKIVSAGRLWFLNFGQRSEMIDNMTEEEFILKRMSMFGLRVKYLRKFTGGSLYLLTPVVLPDSKK